MTDGLPHHIDDALTRPATAADAAVLQLAEEPSSNASAELVRHPATSLFDILASEVTVVVRNYAAFKNVRVTVKDCDCLAEISLQRFSRRILRDILECKPYAIEHLRASVDFVLDVVGCADTMSAIHKANGGSAVDQNLLFMKAEDCVHGMNGSAANQRTAMRIWPDLDKMTGDLARYHRHDSDFAATERVQLPTHAKARCSVKMPKKSVAELLRAATPNREGWFDE